MPENRPLTNQSALLNFIKTSQGKTYTVTAASIILLVLMVLVGVFPAISSVNVQISENEKRAQFLESLNKNISTISSLVKQKEAKDAAVQALDLYLPESNPQSQILQELNAESTKLNLQLKSYSFSEEVNQKDVSKLLKTDERLIVNALRIAMQGTRADLLELINTIENSKRIIDIQSASIFNTTQNTNSYTLDLQVNYYYWQINE